MRNYILGHTQAVYESNYQSHRVEKDLSGLAFGNVNRKLELFKELGNMSLKRDRGAPLYVSSQGQAQLDRRRDVTLLRRLIETSTTEPEHRQTLQLRANELMQQLHRLWLVQARKEFLPRQLRCDSKVKSLLTSLSHEVQLELLPTWLFSSRSRWMLRASVTLVPDNMPKLFSLTSANHLTLQRNSENLCLDRSIAFWRLGSLSYSVQIIDLVE